jgi:nucleotide-binding universal stress UspA family protein
MLKMKKILLPVDFPNTSLPVIHQAAALARHFHAEIVMLHVVNKLSRSSGIPADASKLTGWDMLAEILKEAQKNRDDSLAAELAGLDVHRLIANGDPAQAIVRTAHYERADLIMLPSRGHIFNEFLMGSVTAKVTDAAECPVWTGAHLEELPLQKLPPQKFAIRNILCAVDQRSRQKNTLSWAEQLAVTFGARLTLANVAASSTAWGPGGNYTDRKWNDALMADATRHVADLQRTVGIKTEVFIGCGDMPKVLSQAAKETQADVLVAGCRPYGGHLRTHGYSIIREVPVPVLCVGGS